MSDRAATPHPPLLLDSAITYDAIQRAYAELEARENAAAAGEIIGSTDIVIACNVTPEQLDQVPEEWLKLLKMMLRPDGLLVGVYVASNQHALALGQVEWQVANYAES